MSFRTRFKAAAAALRGHPHVGADDRSTVAASVDAVRSRLDDLDAVLDDIRDRVTGLHHAQDAAAQATTATLAHHRDILQCIFNDEQGNRRRLWEMREDPSYVLPFEEEDPLVSVFITTYSNAESLRTRSIPSALAQTHQNIEVVVVGDAASQEVADAVASFDDPRLRFVNLTTRGPYPEDQEQMWYVAGTPPANEGLRLARGSWIAPNCDDDIFTPDHVETLLACARSNRAELVWGQIRWRQPDGNDQLLGALPPAHGQFGVQAALLHRGLRRFHFELADALFETPGDWGWCRRLLRAGVSMAMVEEVVVEYFPSNLWGNTHREAGTLLWGETDREAGTP